MTQEDIAALQKDQEKLKNHFSQNIPVVSDTKTKDGVKDEKEVSPKVVS